jgi:hypothetical protein
VGTRSAYATGSTGSACSSGIAICSVVSIRPILTIASSSAIPATSAASASARKSAHSSYSGLDLFTVSAAGSGSVSRKPICANGSCITCSAHFGPTSNPINSVSAIAVGIISAASTTAATAAACLRFPTAISALSTTAAIPAKTTAGACQDSLSRGINDRSGRNDEISRGYDGKRSFPDTHDAIGRFQDEILPKGEGDEAFLS